MYTTLENIFRDGKEKLHILADFDATLTTYFVEGKKQPSMISLLRNNSSYL